MEHGAESERNSMNEGFDTAAPAIEPSPVASGYEFPSDDSPPPTHFVEIKLPSVAPAEGERPALPEESTANTMTMATPPKVEPAPTPAPTPVLAVAHHAPALPEISLELPQNSDLVLVETILQKAQTPMAAEPEAPRPRRVRPARVEGTDGPLQMVETAHKEPTPPGA
jgi:hypothetical protein